MFRQVWVDEEDQNMQIIAWRHEPNQDVSFYKLKTLTYCTKTASYLATKYLQKLATDEMYDYPQAAIVTMRDLYMNGLMSGAETINEAF